MRPALRYILSQSQAPLHSQILTRNLCFSFGTYNVQPMARKLSETLNFIGLDKHTMHAHLLLAYGIGTLFGPIKHSVLRAWWRRRLNRLRAFAVLSDPVALSKRTAESSLKSVGLCTQYPTLGSAHVLFDVWIGSINVINVVRKKRKMH